MLKVTIKEEDIREVAVDDLQGASTIYRKSNAEDYYYTQIITYYNLDEGENYCEMCGAIYEGDHCPMCNETDYYYLPCEDIAELVYYYLAKGCMIVINLFDGTEHVFQL